MTDETKTDDVPAGYDLGREDDTHYWPEAEGLGGPHLRDEAIAACREHARRVAEGSELVAELRANAAKAADFIEALVDACEEASDSENLADWIRSIASDRESLRAEVEHLTSRIEALRKRDSEQMAEKAKLRATIQGYDRAMQCEQDGAQAVIGALRSEVERLTELLGEEIEQRETFQAERNAYAAEVEQWRDYYGESGDTFVGLRAEIEQLHRELNEANSRARHYVRARDECLDDIQDLQSELDRIREHGTLGRARTGTPERACWAMVCLRGGVPIEDPVWWNGSQWWCSEPMNDFERILPEDVTRYWTIPEPTEVPNDR